MNAVTTGAWRHVQVTVLPHDPVPGPPMGRGVRYCDTCGGTIELIVRQTGGEGKLPARIRG